MPITPTPTQDLGLHRESMISDEDKRKARLTLALLAERHRALDDLPEIIAMLGVAE